MALLSSLRSSTTPNERLSRLLEFYSAHRLVIQRIMNASFLIYLLRATYGGFNSSGSRVGKGQSTSKKGKKDNRKGRPDRVAVRRSFVKIPASSDQKR
jgi:hypothetical protein